MHLSLKYIIDGVKVYPIIYIFHKWVCSRYNVTESNNDVSKVLRDSTVMVGRSGF